MTKQPLTSWRIELIPFGPIRRYRIIREIQSVIIEEAAACESEETAQKIVALLNERGT